MKNTQKYLRFVRAFCNFGCVASALGAFSVLRAALEYKSNLLPISYINEMTEYTLASLALTAAAAAIYHSLWKKGL